MLVFTPDRDISASQEAIKYMGNVVLSPNIKKEKAFINLNGDIINKDTKEVIHKNEPDFVPPKEEQKQESNNGGKLNELIEKKISAKIDEIVSKKIDDILSKL